MRGALAGWGVSLSFLEWNERPQCNLAPNIPFLSHQETTQGFPKTLLVLIFDNFAYVLPSAWNVHFPFYMCKILRNLQG